MSWERYKKVQWMGKHKTAQDWLGGLSYCQFDQNEALDANGQQVDELAAGREA